MTCTHFWKIKLPNGPTSPGRCKRCGERRDFKNAEEEWEPAPQRSVKAHRRYATVDPLLPRWQEVYRK